MKPFRLTILATCLALAAGAQAAKPAKVSNALSADSVNEAGKAAAAKNAPALLRAQVLLARAHFSPGEIDAANGSNMRRALAAFQKKHDLPDTGLLDEPTWQALNADAAAALVSYTVTEADVAGPYEPVPENMADKAKLSALGYGSIEEALGERFQSSPALLKRLNPGKTMSAGTELLVPNVLDTEPLPKAGKIVVDKSDRSLMLYDAGGQLMAQFPASTGSEHDPLPLGKWKVNGVSKNPVFHYNPKLFWDAEPGDKKARIPAGPNNPVGVAWVDLSKDHYGIHGTPVPSSIGKTQSHGCIRLTNWDVQTLTESVGPGTEVVLQE